MKWIVLLSLTCFTACGQDKQNVHEKISTKPEIFNSKYVRLIQDTSKMMLIENVVIHYDDFYAEADSALLDKPGMTVTVFGIKKARFKGDEIRPGEYKQSIRYRKGDSKFYSE